jgi:eukaryotic-like serine/threonine-protein kinase
MGIVYLAKDPAIGRDVALKLVRLDQFASADEIAHLRLRLAREAAAAGRLSHPGIVTIYQFGADGTIPYVAMEFVHGTPLQELLTRGAGLDVSRTLDLLRQIAEALDYAHSVGVVHRDVKPANILVRADGRAKITDFGIAKLLSQNVTHTGFVLGTPEYMAPEQIMAAQVDGRADQFSLAVMAFIMLSGKRPFQASTPNALMFEIVQREPLPLHEANHQMPAEATSVLRKALAKSAADRFQTCTEFVTELARVVQASSTTPGPQALATETSGNGKRLSLARSLSIATMASGLTLAVIAVVAYITPGPKNAAPTRPTIQQKVALPSSPDIFVNPGDGQRYVRVPSGSFAMGCDNCRANNGPAHAITLTQAFYIGETEVTNEAFSRFVPGRQVRVAAKTPAVNVSWHEAATYCAWAGGRLPTEAEWEFAARGGGKKPEITLPKLAWFKANSNDQLHEAGRKLANAAGLFDMQGNAWEWVADRYSSRYYRTSPSVDPQGPTTGSERVVRGGSALSEAEHSSVAARWALSPTEHDSTVGFRCALIEPTPP